LTHSAFGITVGDGWPYQFLNRWKKVLKANKSQILCACRWKTSQLNDVKSFCETWEQVLNETPSPAHTNFNVDEIRFSTGQNQEIYIFSKEKRNKSNISLKSSKVCTVVPFISAEGKCPLIIYVLGKEHGISDIGTGVSITSKNPYNESRDGPERVYLSSESGYVDTELFVRIMKIFLKNIGQQIILDWSL